MTKRAVFYVADSGDIEIPYGVERAVVVPFNVKLAQAVLTAMYSGLMAEPADMVSYPGGSLIAEPEVVNEGTDEYKERADKTEQPIAGTSGVITARGSRKIK